MCFIAILQCTCSLLFIGLSLYHVFFDKLVFYAASENNIAQTGHAGVGDWQEEVYQMVRHDIGITLFIASFLRTS